MGFFRKKEDEEWNIWDDVPDELFSNVEPVPIQQDININDDASFNNNKKNKEATEKTKPKKRFKRSKKAQEQYILEETHIDEVNYLKSDELYAPNTTGDEFQISYPKVFGFLLVFFILFIGVVGYLNTDFDDRNNAYVVSYDLHYERDYVKQSDEVLKYCEKLHEELPKVMQAMQVNTISATNQMNEYIKVLKVKTEELSRYTAIPEMMSSYHNDLINLSMSTQKMMDASLKRYTTSDYMDWAGAAYTDFETALDNIKVLRGEINSIVYRNVYEK